ncbi:hypothetical protein [Deinococcus arcticus]|uniref:Uncharacterized protein n=1 Tax=Deinococcus arcticus TaxID=2136176 RepID=A0A2T3WAA0_9DEIO|nr:hypothetical protein [Deinococcus arcticus]PTA68825.1 hypothetical protein C8263_06215 [Deinococcus arcticus]
MKLPAQPLHPAWQPVRLDAGAWLRRIWAQLVRPPTAEDQLARQRQRAELRAEYEARLDLYLAATLRSAPARCPWGERP